MNFASPDYKLKKNFLYVYICGDFNANVLPHAMFGNEVRLLCSDNLLRLSDTSILTSNTFTFIGSSHDTTSWMQHVLSTTKVIPFSQFLL